MADAGTRLEQSTLEPKVLVTSFGTIFAVDWRELDLFEGEDGSDVDVEEGENLFGILLSNPDSRTFGSPPLMVLKIFFLIAANMFV
jgi:hypothetical protein